MTINSTCDKNLHIPQFYIDGSVIDVTKEHNYLGVVLSEEFTENETMKKEIRSIYARGNMLNNKFRDCNEEVKIKLFRTFCTNLYCAALWCNFKQSIFSRVRVSHNNVFRAFFKLCRRCSVSQEFVLRNIPNIDVIRRKLVYSILSRVNSSNNVLIKTILDMSFFTDSEMFKTWMKIVF